MSAHDRITAALYEHQWDHDYEPGATCDCGHPARETWQHADHLADVILAALGAETREERQFPDMATGGRPEPHARGLHSRPDAPYIRTVTTFPPIFGEWRRA